MMLGRRAAVVVLGVLLGVGAARSFGQASIRSAESGAGLVREVVRPVRVVRRGDGVVFVDFGRDGFGYLELEVGELGGGKRVGVRMGERLAGADELDRTPGGAVRYWETSVEGGAGAGAAAAAAAVGVCRVGLRKEDGRRMPADVGAVMPFRYVELEGLPAGVTVEGLREGGVRQVVVHYPFDDSAAEFACSDERLNAVWALSKYSMKATSFCGVFVDGDRERKPYEADAYINQLGWYYCTGEAGLPRGTNGYLIGHPTWPTEWIMFSVFSAWLDYRYTGDLEAVKARYEDLKAKTLRGLERGDGLISTVGPGVPEEVKRAIHFEGTLKDVVDWPAGERDGYRMVAVNTVVNAFHCRAMEMMGELAGAIGKGEEAAGFRAAAGRVRESLNAKLVDPTTGLYVDGEGSDHSSQHANLFPLAFGLVPEDRREKVADFVAGRGMACSVYGAQFLMDGLFENGRGAEAVRLMTAAGDRSWRHMVEDVGTTITLEAWDTKYKPNQDWNHAWGAGPANLLPRMVLGAEPLEAGWRRVLVWPRGGEGVSWARGRVPTAGGPVGVEWRRSAEGFRMGVELPAGVGGVVRVPSDRGDEAVVDGKVVKGKRVGGGVEVEVGGGRHEVVVGR